MSLVDQLSFLVRQRFLGFSVAESPWFDSEQSSQWFLDKLSKATTYLEYGTGGSTYAAARLGIDFVAVDSDPYFLRSVEKKIAADGLARAGQTYRRVDIGRTGQWGWPLGRQTPRRHAQFRQYSEVPPELLAGETLPDLVLIDGRFRVACALKSLRMLHTAGTDWTIVVDDYVDRPDYHALAEFADIEIVGRMATISSAKPAVTDPALTAAISRWELIPD